MNLTLNKSTIKKLVAGQVLIMGLFSFLWQDKAAASGLTMGVPEHEVVKVEVERSGPTLLFSDSPEAVYETGILYQDTLTGEGRVFIHHVNETKENLKLAVMVRPGRMKAVNVTWKNRGIGGPDQDFFKAAREGQKEYWQPVANTTRQLGLLDSYEVLSQKEAAGDEAGIILKPGQLVTGMFDFSTDDKLQVTVLMCKPGDGVEEFAGRAKILPMDEHPLRGTFEKADLTYTVTTSMKAEDKKAYALSMAGAHDNYLLGIDATTKLPAENYGNYGVVYRVKYALEGKKDWDLILNPEGGAFSGYCVQANNNETQIVAFPDLSVAYSEEADAMFHIDKLKHKKGRINGTLVWSPPGAANLPIRVFWKPTGLK